jgi:hypothetical protein
MVRPQNATGPQIVNGRVLIGEHLIRQQVPPQQLPTARSSTKDELPPSVPRAPSPSIIISSSPFPSSPSRPQFSTTDSMKKRWSTRPIEYVVNAIEAQIVKTWKEDQNTESDYLKWLVNERTKLQIEQNERASSTTVQSVSTAAGHVPVPVPVPAPAPAPVARPPAIVSPSPAPPAPSVRRRQAARMSTGRHPPNRAAAAQKKKKQQKEKYLKRKER